MISHIDPDVAVQTSLGISLVFIIAIIGVLCRIYIRSGNKLAGLGILIGTLLTGFWLVPTFLAVTRKILEQ